MKVYMVQVQEKNMLMGLGRSQFLATTQLVLSLSVFSLLFSYYLSFFSHSLKSVFPFQQLLLLTHRMDKTCVFLICNGILVFLVKTSGSLYSRSGLDLDEHTFVRNLDQYGLQKVVTESKDESMLDDQKELEKLVEEEKRVIYEDFGVDLDKKNSSLSMEEEEEAVEGYLVMDEKEKLTPFETEERYKEEGMEALSTEELNKKFDEFIRKMKEELRIDAQRQIVLVQ